MDKRKRCKCGIEYTSICCPLCGSVNDERKPRDKKRKIYPNVEYRDSIKLPKEHQERMEINNHVIQKLKKCSIEISNLYKGNSYICHHLDHLINKYSKMVSRRDKVCPRCGVRREMMYFSKEVRRRDGVRSNCIYCEREKERKRIRNK